MRLGLGPFDDLKHCICGASLSSLPLHFLTCNLLRSSITVRHDLIFQSLAKAARLCGIAVQSEPSLAIGFEGSRSDGQFFFPSLSAHLDVSVVHPAAPAYLKQKAGGAIKKRETEKNTLYLEAARRQGAEFYAGVFDSFGGFEVVATTFVLRLAEEIRSSGIKSHEDQSVKAFINRCVSFALMRGNGGLLLTGARLARSRP